MRFLPIAAALPLALAACSGGAEDASEGEPMTDEEISAELDKAPEIRPGEYRSQATLLEFEVAGMPAGQVDSMRSMFAGSLEQPTTYCITPEQAAKGPEEMIAGLAESNCTMNGLTIEGGSMMGEIQCTGDDGGLSGTVKIDSQFTENSSTTTMETVQSIPGLPGEGARLKWRTEAERVGECAA